jgi:hypothetical protein
VADILSILRGIRGRSMGRQQFGNSTVPPLVATERAVKDSNVCITSKYIVAMCTDTVSEYVWHKISTVIARNILTWNWVWMFGVVFVRLCGWAAGFTALLGVLSRGWVSFV